MGEKVRGYGGHRDYITNTFNVQSRICWGKPFWKTVGELLRSERQLGRGQKLGENKSVFYTANLLLSQVMNCLYKDRLWLIAYSNSQKSSCVVLGDQIINGRTTLHKFHTLCSTVLHKLGLKLSSDSILSCIGLIYVVL